MQLNTQLKMIIGTLGAIATGWYATTVTKHISSNTAQVEQVKRAVFQSKQDYKPYDLDGVELAGRPGSSDDSMIC